MGVRWRLLLALLAVLGIVGLAAPATAAPPWQNLLPFRRVEADPQKSYPLAEEHGPWLILATTFAGEGSEARAQELVYELRKRYKLNAYTHRRHFDFRGDLRPAGRNRYGEPLKARYRREEIEEVAVLVGDFPTVDDDRAQKTLQMLKYECDPECLKPSPKKLNDHPLGGFRGVWKTIQNGTGFKTVKKKSGPLATALLTTNPLLPDEYFAPKGLDKFVIEMNRPVKHSLLDCPGRYTLRIATFSGRVIIKQEQIREIEERGRPLTSSLVDAAEKAHRVAEALREQGYEAYEFHDRQQSIVTVGSFDSCGTPRPDGRIEINPKIHTLMTTFGADKQLVGGQAAPRIGMPKTVDGIPLDIQPMIVEVPRKSISSDYAGGLLGR